MEAALVMSLTLFFLAALLSGVFEVHRRVVGNFLLQEALEQSVFPASEEWNGEKTLEEIRAQAHSKLEGFFGCGQMKLQLKEEGRKKKGTVGTPVFSELSVSEYEPEDTLRMWAVLRAGVQRRDSGGSLQERMEP